MPIDPVSPGLRILPADVPLKSAGRVGAADHTFGQQLEDAVSGINLQQQDAEDKVSSMLAGGGTDVHDAMIAVQKADLSFQLMLQVRNKVVQAYQEIERMQF